ncbi:HAD-IIA family hydrolase [Desulfosarcina ovata]|uniref:Haloacid dehalogenase n=2 Tax=Desulfosarcina ovata TaxID=83564 RepID=A0A5K8AJR8_9BACT|nr:HAD-IIA family hydrolase [Desulfosarcina ovata]BBO85984.1 haloacid dehalogenase [Desulfosarcina ovata subsp. sediminis]BBO92942.1 haloacid dehalogenase [Desulfosarcina ovata subsp. ovata]
MKAVREKSGFICDMDGVIYHGDALLPKALEFVNWLEAEKKDYLFLTNNSQRSREELHQKLRRLGIEVDAMRFYTAALATASFLANQCPNGSAYVIGDAGLTNALYQAGFSMNDVDPDYVVVGETSSYSFEKVSHAINLVLAGARLVGTNPDLVLPMGHKRYPGCGSLIAPIELATGRQAYFMGKPNPLMIRHALRCLACTREETVFIGDSMETDIIAGINSEVDTALVLSGTTAKEDLDLYSYRPRYVLNSVGDILD